MKDIDITIKVAYTVSIRGKSVTDDTAALLEMMAGKTLDRETAAGDEAAAVEWIQTFADESDAFDYCAEIQGIDVSEPSYSLYSPKMEEVLDTVAGIISSSDYFKTQPGERFREWNGITGIESVISVQGRSRERRSLPIEATGRYITHLYLTPDGTVMALEGDSDDDDMTAVVRGKGRPLREYGLRVAERLAGLLTYPE